MTLSFHNATIEPLWSGLNFSVRPGEFLTVLGPNGVGKSTLLGAIMGTRKLTAGRITATDRIGYIPQQRMFPPELPLRARDLVGLSLAHGVVRGRRPRRQEVDELLARIGARIINQYNHPYRINCQDRPQEAKAPLSRRSEETNAIAIIERQDAKIQPNCSLFLGDGNIRIDNISNYWRRFTDRFNGGRFPRTCCSCK